MELKFQKTGLIAFSHITRKCISALFLLFFIVSTAAADISFTEDEKEFIRKHPILNVVSAANWAPYEYFEEYDGVSRYEGVNITLLEMIGKKTGIDFSFIPTSDFEKSIKLFDLNKADIITGYTALLEGHEEVSFTEPVYEIDLLLLTHDEDIEKGSTIAVVPNPENIEEQIYSLFPKENYQYLTFNSPKEVIKRFKNSNVDACIIGGFEQMADSDLTGYRTINLGISIPYRIGYAKRLGEVANSIFRKAIESITPEELEQQIYRTQSEHRFHMRENELIREQRSRITILAVTVCVLLLAVAFAISALVLRKKTRTLGYDEITGLPTFTQFKHHIKQILKNAGPDEYMLLSLDINNFKFINDGYGFVRGNLLLVELAQQFQEQCEPGEFVCRYYADNFIVFAKNPGFIALVEDKVYKLTSVDEDLQRTLPQQYKLTFSSSVYYINEPSADITSMVDKANLARKYGKEKFATQRVIEYTRKMDEENEWKKEIVLTMDKALDNNEFEVFYQPKFYLSNAKVLGAEALIRWNHPQKGLLPPDKFIPLFENNGFIQKIDIYVFERVCKFLSDWNTMGPGGTCPNPITISFNLSRYHLYNPDLISTLTTIFNKYDVSPSHVEVELTESIMFDNSKKLISVMNDIKKAGFSISVDDFGSGYSSLNLLKEIPADVLKLDKEFLSKADDDKRENIIITSVIEMAKKLKMTTVAEGIETKKQSDLLRDMGCDVAQGYYYAKPMPEREFLALLYKSFLPPNT